MGRWGLGPVFALEWLTGSRRWQVYAGRSLYAAVLLAALASVWGAQVYGQTFLTVRSMAEIGWGFYRAIVFAQLTLTLIAAPAATAGALCQDRARGNLALVLATGLSDFEIVLGKLGARLAPVLSMACCTLPVLALGSLLGGIDPLALAGSFAVTVGVAVLACAIALAFSLWGTRPHEVLLATFAVLALWLLGLPVYDFFVFYRGLPGVPRWVDSTHPYYLALAPNQFPGKVRGWDFLGFLAGTSLIAAVLVRLSIVSLRRVVLRQGGRARGRGRVRMWGGGRGPSLERSPLGWYEWHRRRPTPWIRGLVALYAGLAVSFSLLAIDDCIRPSTSNLGWLPAFVNAFQVVMGMPLLVIAAATALVDERARGSLDVLLATPVSTRRIVLAKWWSIFGQVERLLVLPVLVAAVEAGWSEDWRPVVLLAVQLVVWGAAWTSIGLALSTWFSSLARAVAAAVVLFALVALGWPMFVLTAFGEIWTGAKLALVSPFYGSFYLTRGVVNTYLFEKLYPWSLLWIFAYAIVALSLLLATLATFDRCIGRVPERGAPPTRPGRAPRRRGG